MKLPLDELARRLDLPRTTVARWLAQGRIPAQREGDSVAFDRAQVVAWARTHHLVLRADDEPSEKPEAPENEGLVAAMRRGGVHGPIGGGDAAAVLTAAARLVPAPEAERERLRARLLEREELASTGVGKGVAIPHPRNPMPEVAPRPQVTTCFLERPVDFGALDRMPVEVLFVTVSPTVKRHLETLSRLAHCLHSERLHELLAHRPAADDLLIEIGRIEAGLDEENAE